jgi:3-oxoacyl-[acyl-carrier-protein] synthase III
VRTPEVYIAGVGTEVPPSVSVERAIAEGWCPPERLSVHHLGGAAVAGEVPAPELALRAALRAIKRAGWSPAAVDLLAYVSTWHQGPEGWPPQAYIQRHLLGDVALALQLRQGCNGMFTAMELAASYLSAVPQRSAALVVTGDNYGTALMDRWRLGPASVSGDAGSALLLTKAPGLARLLAVGSMSVVEGEEIERAGEPLFPPGITEGRGPAFAARTDEFRRRAIARGSGTELLLTMQRRQLEVVERTLAESEIGLPEVTRVAFMNYSREIAEQFCASLGLTLAHSTWELGRDIGHCGASDQIIGFERLMTTGELGPGDHLLMFGRGPGAEFSCAVVQVLDSPAWGNSDHYGRELQMGREGL